METPEMQLEFTENNVVAFSEKQKIIKGIKVVINPNPEQINKMDLFFNACTKLFNDFLKKCEAHYEETKKHLSYFDTGKLLTLYLKEPENTWIAMDIPRETSELALKNLDTAYQNFFKGITKNKPKEKTYIKQSFKCRRGIHVKDGCVYFPGFRDGVQIKYKSQHNCLPTPCRILELAVSKDRTGKYWASFNVECEYEKKSQTVESPDDLKIVGIDLGITDFIVSSDGVRWGGVKHYQKYDQRLKRLQQILATKQKGSNNYKKLCTKIAKIHNKIKNCRKDMVHQVSRKIVDNNDIIVKETLAIENMVKNHKLARSIYNAAWGDFGSKLAYKASWEGKRVVEIDRFFASSKVCSICGSKNADLKLSDRTWVCENGHTLDRDLNAAINIRNEGIRILNEPKKEKRRFVRKTKSDTSAES